MTDIPHFTLPFQWTAPGTGGVAALTCEQESVTEIGSCCEAILRTVQGQRTTLPAFGRLELEFNTDPGVVRAALAQALLQWERRVQSLIEAAPDPEDAELQIVRALIAPVDSEEGNLT